MAMLSRDYREFIQSLNAHKVRYLVIGGYALAFHGHPRYTKDIDIWVEVSASNAAVIIKALREFGFASLDLQEKDFLEPDQIIQLGYPPNRIDLVTSASGVDFSACYNARRELDLDGISVAFIDLENLRKNKKASGRKQDLADLESLE
jgi:predicted nucleotidyltransferase